MNPLTKCQIPANFCVLERGWLSSNTIIVMGSAGAAVVDTGYVTHAAQTVSLIEATLQAWADTSRADRVDVTQVINTHLHSDHCGGNASVVRRWPGAQLLIPPGHAREVRDWDESALTFSATGQQCERFAFDATLVPGEPIMLSDDLFEVHAAPGHDPHSVVLFHPTSRGLISADALWNNGFGVVFPALEGIDAFREVGATLDVIEALQPLYVIPGHGAVFNDVAEALARARARLAYFEANPDKHAMHGMKVLIKFKMLEIQRTSLASLLRWIETTPYFALAHGVYAKGQSLGAWAQSAVQSLVSGGALAIDGDVVANRDT